MTYIPPFEITNKASNLVSSISEKVGALGNYSNIAADLHLRRDSQIESIHSSLKIEANSLSFDEVRDVINSKPVYGDRNEILEVKNAFEAYEKIDEVDPYSIDDLLMVHGIMTRGLIEESGRFRSGNEGVFSNGRCIFMAPPAKLVSELMSSLFAWMNAEKAEVHPLILSSVFHYEFVFIHPFADGNGRMARLWQSALLARWRRVFELIPIESETENLQSDYYSAIESCHSAGNSTQFIEFMLEQIDRVIDRVDRKIKMNCAQNDIYINRLLSVMSYGVPYSASQLLSELGLKSRDSFRANYLQPAIDAGLVEMTIPDKPTSRNQRYIKV